VRGRREAGGARASAAGEEGRGAHRVPERADQAGGAGEGGGEEAARRVYASRCLEPITGSSTGSAFERELAVAYALAERGLGWSEELEKLSRVFRVEQGLQHGSELDPRRGRPAPSAREGRSEADARLGGCAARVREGAPLPRLPRRQRARGAVQRRSRGRGPAPRPSGSAGSSQSRTSSPSSSPPATSPAGGARRPGSGPWRCSSAGAPRTGPPTPSCGASPSTSTASGSAKPSSCSRWSRASLLRSAASSASLWYCWVASHSELEEAGSKLDPLWQEAHRVAAGRVSGFLPAAAAPVALALLEQAAAEGLDPDGFLAKLDKLLGAGGDPVELLLSWDARGWRLSTLLLATRAFEVRLERGYEMLVVDRVAAEEALEAGREGARGEAAGEGEGSAPAAKLREGVAERWLKLVSLLLALEIVGRACELRRPREQEAGEAREAGYKAVRARRSGWRRGCRRGREEGWKEVPGGQRVREKDRGRAVRRPQESSGDPAESPRQQLTEKRETGSQNRAPTATPKDRRAGNRNRAKAARRNRRKRAKPTGYRTPETGIVTVLKKG